MVTAFSRQPSALPGPLRTRGPQLRHAPLGIGGLRPWFYPSGNRKTAGGHVRDQPFGRAGPAGGKSVQLVHIRNISTHGEWAAIRLPSAACICVNVGNAAAILGPGIL